MKLVHVVAAATTVIALAVVAPPSASAAGVDPGAVTLTLAPGASSTVPVRVTTPAVAPKPDIVLLADTTGSMDPALANVRNNVPAMISEVRSAQPDARFAVAEYKEQVDGNRVFTVDTPLTDDADLVQAGTQQWLYNVGGGGVPWTDFVNAHYRIATDAVAFRPGGTPIVLWFGDAVSHDPSLGHTLADTGNALRSLGARVVAVPVVGTSGDGLDQLGQASSIVAATNGRLMANSTADQVAEGLLAGLHTLDLTVTHQASCDPALSMTFDAASRAVRSGTDATFAGTVGVRSDAAPGTYRCTVDYLVEGVTQGLTQTVTVTVPGGPVPALSVADVSVAEGDSGTTSAVFTVSLDAPAAGPVTVHAATADGTAVSPADFTATTADLTFAPGELTKTVSVPVVGDTVLEPDETFTLGLSTASGAEVADGQGVGTIRNDDGPAPRMSVGDVTVTEGNAGVTQAVFTVSLDHAAAGPVTAHAATADGTAAAPGDFTATSADLTFAAGETSKQITVPVVGDAVFEPDETFVLNLSAVSGADVLDGQGVGTIRNDDPIGQRRLSVGDVSVAEGDTGTADAVFTVSLDGPATGPVTVHAATANGTATAPSDFIATSGDLTFAAGETTKQVRVPVVGDTDVESDETFVVELSAVSGAEVLDGQGVGTILNDDTVRPRLSIGDMTVAEGNAGATSASFTVSLDRTSTVPVAVHYTTVSGTATAGQDFGAVSGDVLFLPGQASQQVAVTVVGDTVDEPDETFTVQLSAPTAATIADGTGVGTITDDDRNGRFDCRASALTVLGSQPAVANPAGIPCADVSRSAPSATLGSLLLGVRLTGGTVRTGQTPDDLTTAPAAGDNASATTELAATRITATALTIELGTITSRATARCVPAAGGLAPSLVGTSTIGSLRINGIRVPIGDGPVTIPLVIGSLKLNGTTTTATSVTQRAVELHTLLGDVVLGEARAGVQGTPAHPTGSPCAR